MRAPPLSPCAMPERRCLRLALSSASLVRGSPSTGCAKSWDCWRRRSSGVPSRGSVEFWGSSCSTSRLRRALTIWQHWFASDALGIVTVAPLLIGVAAAARDPPPPNEALEGPEHCCDNGDEHACYLSAARIIRDCGADCPAVPAVAVAGGSLPAGIRRGGRVHRCADNRVDDNLWHWIFRRPRSPDRRPHRGRPGGHPDDFALHARSCRAVRGAASAGGCAQRGGDPAGKGPGGRRGHGLRVGCPHRFIASQRERGEYSWIRPASAPYDSSLSCADPPG